MHATTFKASELPREWRFDVDTCPFVNVGALIRVVALHSSEAVLLKGAREQAEDLCRDLFEHADQPVAGAKCAIADAFRETTDPAETAQSERTVLAYYNAESGTWSDRVVGFSRVAFDGERVMISPIAVTLEMTEDVQEQVLRAIVIATEEFAMKIAHNALKEQPTEPVVIWRDLLGASGFLTNLLTSDGYSAKLTERVEMTAWMKDLGSADTQIADSEVDSIEIRPLDLVSDDVEAVWGVLKEAFSPNPPSYDAWKHHYAQQPRFAPEMSFVAWQGQSPIAVSCVELIVDGEGGGEEEVTKVFATHRALVATATLEPCSGRLEFPGDYEERKATIRARAKVGYVCGVATLPAFRGRRLAQTLLRHNFRAAARARLDSVFLGTDRYNPAAVRAYLRAGMVETTAVNPGNVVAKVVSVAASPRG